MIKIDTLRVLTASGLSVGLMLSVGLGGCGAEKTNAEAYAAPTLDVDDLCQEIDDIEVFTRTTDSRWIIGSSTPSATPDRLVNRLECHVEGDTPNGSFTLRVQVTGYGGKSRSIAKEIAKKKPAELCDREKESSKVQDSCRVHFSEYLSTPRVQSVDVVPGSSIVVDVTVSATAEADRQEVEGLGDKVIDKIATMAKE